MQPRANGDRGTSQNCAPTLTHLQDGTVIPLVHREPPEPGGAHPQAHRGRSQEGREVASARLGDGTVLEAIQDPENSSRAIFASWKGGTISLVERFESGGQAFVPLRRDGGIGKSIQLPNGVEPFESPAKLATEAGALISQVVEIPRGLWLLLGAFVVHTWVPEVAPFFPCPLLRGPSDFIGPLLQALALVCRQAIVVGHTTPAGLLHAFHGLTPTLLVDDRDLSPRVRRLVRMGTRRDVVALEKGTVVSPSGPRLVGSSSDLTGSDLVEDAILLAFGVRHWPDVTKLSDRGISERARRLRNSLLRFRFERSQSIQPLVGECPSGLSPKSWDMLRVLAGPFVGDEEFCTELLGLRLFPPFEKFPWENQPQWLSVRKQAVVSTLFFHAHKRYAEGARNDTEVPLLSVTVGELTTAANQVLEQMGERPSLTARGFGAQMDSLGFSRRTRGDVGYEVDFTRATLKQVHYLVKYYGLHELRVYHGQDRERCSWCRDLKLVSDSVIQLYGRESKLARQQSEQVRQKRIKRGRRRRRPAIDAAPHGRERKRATSKVKLRRSAFRRRGVTRCS